MDWYIDRLFDKKWLKGMDRYEQIVIVRSWFGLASLFNGISTFVGYSMPKLFS